MWLFHFSVFSWFFCNFTSSDFLAILISIYLLIILLSWWSLCNFVSLVLFTSMQFLGVLLFLSAFLVISLLAILNDIILATSCSLFSVFLGEFYFLLHLMTIFHCVPLWFIFLAIPCCFHFSRNFFMIFSLVIFMWFYFSTIPWYYSHPTQSGWLLGHVIPFSGRTSYLFPLPCIPCHSPMSPPPLLPLPL